MRTLIAAALIIALQVPSVARERILLSSMSIQNLMDLCPKAGSTHVPVDCTGYFLNVVFRSDLSAGKSTVGRSGRCYRTEVPARPPGRLARGSRLSDRRKLQSRVSMRQGSRMNRSAPEVLEAIWRKLRVANGMLDIPMPQPCLQGPCIVAVVGQLKARRRDAKAPST